MKGIDLFTCTFPASICQLWLDLNKTVVFLPAHRYNLGRCLPREWHKLDDQIRQLVSQVFLTDWKQQNPINFEGSDFVID